MAHPKLLRSVGTHDGTFHADEVSACALLLVFNLIDEDRIIRTRDPEKLAVCEYVCDVGGIYDPQQKLFDHHQAEYQGPLSSAGMVLAYLKDQNILTQGEFDLFNNSLIKGVDDHDNGRASQDLGYCTFSHVVANFTPVSYEADGESQDKAFHEALHFVAGHLKRALERYHYNLACREVVAETMQKNPLCLIFDRSIPWLESFFELDGKNHSALFVIMPSGDHWKLRGIPPDYENRMKVRKPLPLEWAGLLDNDLKKITGINGAIFCHKGRFTSVWETKEDALKALNLIMKENNYVK